MLPSRSRSIAPLGHAVRPASTAAPPSPIRFRALYAELGTACPGVLHAYGKCVADKVAAGDLGRGVCAREFAELRACSQTVLDGMRAQRRAG